LPCDVLDDFAVDFVLGGAPGGWGGGALVFLEHLIISIGRRGGQTKFQISTCGVMVQTISA
jgi:hypothetical protein